MKHTKLSSAITIDKIALREQIMRSMIASFHIEGIEISEQLAKDTLDKIKLKLR